MSIQNSSKSTEEPLSGGAIAGAVLVYALILFLGFCTWALVALNGALVAPESANPAATVAGLVSLGVAIGTPIAMGAFRRHGHSIVSAALAGFGVQVLVTVLCFGAL